MARSSRGGGTKVQRRLLIAVAALAIPLVAGCEAGNNAPSLRWHHPTDGSGKTVGGITISNAFVLGAPIGSVLHAGQNAGLFLGLTNIGVKDTLTAISAPGVAATVKLSKGQVVLASDDSVLLTGPKPDVVLKDLTHPLTGGSVLTIFLHFAKAGTVKLQVPVMPAARYFTTLSPPASPTPKPSPSVSSASAKATPSPSHS